MVLIIIGLPVALVSHGHLKLRRRELSEPKWPTVCLGRSTEKHTWIYIVIVGAVVSITLFLLGRYSAISGAPDTLKRQQEF